jgi:hypothetical protein
LAGPAKTGVCFVCRVRGAAFAREWMHDLRQRGLTTREIGEVVGTTADAVRARLRDRRERAA